jgi:hypothetical protein
MKRDDGMGESGSMPIKDDHDDARDNDHVRDNNGEVRGDVHTTVVGEEAHSRIGISNNVQEEALAGLVVATAASVETASAATATATGGIEGAPGMTPGEIKKQKNNKKKRAKKKASKARKAAAASLK